MDMAVVFWLKTRPGGEQLLVKIFYKSQGNWLAYRVKNRNYTVLTVLYAKQNT